MKLGEELLASCDVSGGSNTSEERDDDRDDLTPPALLHLTDPEGTLSEGVRYSLNTIQCGFVEHVYIIDSGG